MAYGALDQDGAAGKRSGRETGGAVLVHGEGTVGSHRGDAEARGNVGSDAVGQAHDVLGREHCRLLRGAGRAAVRGEVHPDAIADRQVLDVLADRIDDAGAVLVRYHLVEGEIAISARLPVGRIHARREDADADLVGAGRPLLPVDEGEDGGVTGAGVDDRPHTEGKEPGGPGIPGRAISRRRCSAPAAAERPRPAIR